MALKFRLQGLAETFIENISCPCCQHDGGDDGDSGFQTELTRVTLEGIIVVISCDVCGYVFVPDGQRLGIINSRRLQSAVEKDSENTGQPLFPDMNSVKLDVERINATTNGSGAH